MGITIIANEQTFSGNGIDNAALEVNALHIIFDDVPAVIGLTAGLLDGDIIISHSEASLTAERSTAVPEPSSMLILASGIGVIFGLRRKRLCNPTHKILIYRPLPGARLLVGTEEPNRPRQQIDLPELIAAWF